MAKFGKHSRQQLSTCEYDLQSLFNEVIKGFDCKVVEGYRRQKDQDLYYRDGKSRVKWPNGKHNKHPSRAVDVYPYPIDFKDMARFYYFAGYVKGVADSMGIKIRWGGDWNNNTQSKDERFLDLVHFELLD